jgi:hypothetical protein
MLYDAIGAHWWVGVVEDRNDPEKMGRIKVRIFGIHPEDTSELSKDDLPWALLMTPATSASISGIGTSPVGILHGSWVVGFFMDGADKQQPIVVGTVPTKPEKKEDEEQQQQQSSSGSDFSGSNQVTNSAGEPVTDGSGNPIQSTPTEVQTNYQDTTTGRAVTNSVGSLTPDDVNTLIQGLQSSTGTGGVGKYNFTVRDLEYMGYLKPLPKNSDPNDVLNNPGFWTGKDQVRNITDIEKNALLQDYMANQLINKSYKDLARSGKLNDKSDKAYTAGLLTASFRTGVKNADKFDVKDNNNTFVREYYSSGAKNFGNPQPPPPKADVGNRAGNFGGSPSNPGNVPSGQLNDPSATSTKGFEDPDKVYPTKEYMDKKLPDTNKLAAGDKTSNVLVYKKDNRIEDILIGYSKDTWSEPESPYSAKYPHNQVFATEAGHVVEFDNTPGRERIQLWHKANTYIEIDVNGTQVRKVVGDDYEIIEKNSYAYIKGCAKTTIEGVQRVLVKDSMYVQVWGDINVTGQSDITINGAKKVNVTATDEMKIQSGGPVNVYSDATVTIQGSPRIDLNPGGVDNSFKKPEKKSPKEVEPKPLEAPKTSEEDLQNEEGEQDSKETANEREQGGEIVDKQPQVEDEDSNIPVQRRGGEVDKGEFQNATNIPDTMKLSNDFTIGALTNRAAASPTPLQDNRGLTKAQIAGNLKALAVNVLDPIKKQFPDMFVTSGFRVGSETSDHGIGAAADLQFNRRTTADYYEVAKWIKNNVPYTQLLLEYQDRPSGRIAWIHVAYKEDTPQSALPIATFYNHRPYRRGSLVKLSS